MANETNAEKAQEISKDFYMPDTGFNREDLYDSAIEMAQWKDVQLKEQKQQLIDKACDVLVNCIEDYMSRRMEVWNEECKKQTLENIRKKLEE